MTPKTLPSTSSTDSPPVKQTTSSHRAASNTPTTGVTVVRKKLATNIFLNDVQIKKICFWVYFGFHKQHLQRIGRNKGKPEVGPARVQDRTAALLGCATDTISETVKN